MVNALTFTAQPRQLLGKKAKRLLKDRKVPANIYGSGLESVAIALNTVEFTRLYDQAGDTTLIYVTVEGEKTTRPVLVEEVMSHPVTGQLTHVVLKQVNLKEKIKANIPVEVVGEFKVPNAVLVTVHDEIEVEALPTDLPEKFEIDAANLTEIGQAVTFADLKIDSSKLMLTISEEEKTTPVVMVQAQQVEEEAPAETTPAEGEAAAPAAPESASPTEEKAA